MQHTLRTHRFVLLLVSLVLVGSLASGVGAATPPTSPTQAGPSSLQSYPLTIVRLDSQTIAAIRQHPATSQPLLGTGGANVDVEPDVIASPSNNGLVGIASAGYQPGELLSVFLADVQLSISPQPVADPNGFYAFVIEQNQFNAFGASSLWFRVVGNSSGKVAGDVLTTASGATARPGISIVPRAARPGDPVLLIGSGFPATSALDLRAGLTAVGSVSTDQYGSFATLYVSNSNASPGANVINAFQLGTVGSLAGQSLAVQPDAGPPTSIEGDRAPATARVDRATAAIGGVRFAVGGEGFAAGETVSVTNGSNGQTLTSLTADSRGAAGGVVSYTVSVASELTMTLRGLSSNRLAYAAILFDSEGVNLPSGLVVPARSLNGASNQLLYTKLANAAPVQISINYIPFLGTGAVLTNTTSSSDGVINLTLPLTQTNGVVSNISATGGGGLAASAVWQSLGNPGSVGTVAGRVYDSSNSQGLTATIALSTFTATTNSSGNFAITSVPVGTYVVTATASNACFTTLTQTVSIGVGTTRVNFPLVNQCSATASVTAINATSTPASTATASRTATSNPTVGNTATAGSNTVTATATSPAATATNPTGSPTATVTGVAVTATATSGGATATATATPAGTTATATPAGTTATATSVVSATATSGPSATPCTISFTDVGISNIFYTDITFLACRGIVNGFPNGDGTFRFEPNSNTRRGEFAKIAVAGFGLPSFTPAVNPTFTDVPRSNTFFRYIEAAAQAGAVNGLSASQCASLGVPSPCFGPNVNISRVQVVVIVQRIRNYEPFTPTTPTFVDVPAAAFGYTAIETLVSNNIINGAACPGGVGLCFRPNDNIRRGELSKVVRRAIEIN